MSVISAKTKYEDRFLKLKEENSRLKDESSKLRNECLKKEQLLTETKSSNSFVYSYFSISHIQFEGRVVELEKQLKQKSEEQGKPISLQVTSSSKDTKEELLVQTSLLLKDLQRKLKEKDIKTKDLEEKVKLLVAEKVATIYHNQTGVQLSHC